MLFGHLYAFFGEIYLDLLPIFGLGCFFDTELHELFVYFGDSLSVASFANIFSHSVGYLCCAKAFKFNPNMSFLLERLLHR